MAFDAANDPDVVLKRASRRGAKRRSVRGIGGGEKGGGCGGDDGGRFRRARVTHTVVLLHVTVTPLHESAAWSEIVMPFKVDRRALSRVRSGAETVTETIAFDDWRRRPLVGVCPIEIQVVGMPRALARFERYSDSCWEVKAGEAVKE